jgi:hypothetical protein
MEESEQPTVFYVSRGKAALVVCLGLALLVLDWASYGVPKPSGAIDSLGYDDPFKTGIFLTWGAGCLLLVLTWLYRLVTPLPVLQVDSTGLVYRPFPFVRRGLHWAEVERLGAFQLSYRMSWLVHVERLELLVQLTPEAMEAHGNREWLSVKLNGRLLPVGRDVVVRQIQRYHPIDYEYHAVSRADRARASAGDRAEGRMDHKSV